LTKKSRLIKIYLKSAQHQSDNLKALREQPKLSWRMPTLLMLLDLYAKF